MRLQRLEWVYKDFPIYYLALVARDRKWLFADPEFHQAFNTFAHRAIDYRVAVGQYTLMSDHIHLFAAFGPESIDLSMWVKSFKNSLSKHLRCRRISAPHWQ